MATSEKPKEKIQAPKESKSKITEPTKTADPIEPPQPKILDPEEEFEEKLKKISNDNRWFALLLFILNWPGFAFVLLYSQFITHGTKIRCEIPDLEDVFTFDQIQRLSQENMPRSCHYYDIDYSVIINEKFEDALNYVNWTDVGEEICRDVVIDPDKRTIFKENSIYCPEVNILKSCLLLSPLMGRFLGGFVSFYGDLLGRKRLMKWGADTIVLLSFCIPLCGVYGTIVCRFFIGIAYQVMEVAMFSIILDYSNSKNSSYRIILVNCGASLGFILCFAFTRIMVPWRFMQWMISAPVLTLPFIAWYIPESASWIKEYDSLQYALDALNSFKSPIQHNEFIIFEFRNRPSRLWKKYKELMRNFRHYCKDHIWYFLIILFFSSSVNFKNFLLSQDVIGHLYVGHFLYGLASAIGDIPAYLISICMLYVFNKKKSIFITYLVCGVAYFIAIFFKETGWERVVVLLIADIETVVLNLIATAYAAENTPINQRCTCIGMMMSLGKLLPNIVANIVSAYMTSFQMLIVAITFSFLGGLFMALAYLLVKGFHIDILERQHIN